MDKKSTLIYILVIAVIIIAAIGIYYYFSVQSPIVEENGNDNQQNQMEEIKITSLAENGFVSSPLTIEGEARGTWYFEATFLVKLADEDGNTMVQGYATAEGDWMTEDFVPFTARLEFENPDTKTGKLILEKANPSGLEENAKSVEIPVRFEKGQAQQTAFATPEEKVKQDIENWIRNSSPTFKFDGMNLSFIRLQKLNFEDCPDCYIAEYEFKSRYAGYGDRAGEMLAQVIVPHSITLLVSEGKVTRAVTDAKYDEVRQEFINVGI
ncbi:MAG: Gmad2 immunoglobulin-like domain-containing protein [bacterium]|nr:Gmad2 immunoglobulin-like domain-containing protein [bacterium]